jgi:NAD(P)-dependent dehydrogenase (short-subunit alcohol dehydrogenase family)
MKLTMSDSVAIVTGGGSGIGREICLQLAAAGGAVAVLDMTGDNARAVAAEAVARGGRSLALVCDIGDAAQVRAGVAEVVATLGEPGLLFNVAGIVKYARVEQLDLATFNRVLAVNLTGAFLLSQAVLPYLVSNRGSIVNVSSMAGHLGIPYAAAYCASKGGLIALTKSMAKEFADRGVRVNVLAPGGVETPMAAVPFPDDASLDVLKLIPMTPLGFAKPADIAAVAVFVASKQSGNLSGALIPIDGAST